MAKSTPYIKYLSELLHEPLTPIRRLGAAMVPGGAMLAEFVHPHAKK